MAIPFRQATFSGVAVDASQYPTDGLPEIIIAGRSNVGKSSLINRLTDQRKLARISQAPGKTRQVLFFKVGESCYLVDLPGYGYARVSRTEQELFSKRTETYLQENRPIALLLLLLDIRIEPTAQDLQMLNWLEESGCDWRIVLTKSDKLSRSAAIRHHRDFARYFDLADENELILFSAQTGAGTEELRSVIEAAVDHFNDF